MNKKKIPAIVLFVLSALMLIAGLVLIFAPSLFVKPVEAPVKVTQDVKLTYYGYDDGEEWYVFSGKMQNVSDEEITIDGIGGLVVKAGSNTIDRNWKEGNADITLAPNQVYNFDEATRMYNGNPSVTSVKVTIDGTTYEIYSSGSPLLLPAVLLILAAIVFMAIGAVVLKNVNAKSKSDAIVEGLRAQIGGNTIVLKGILADKNAQKAAAAKTAASAAAGAVSLLLFGAGGFRTYSAGSQQKDFVLSDDALYTTDDTNGGVYRAAKDNFPVSSITSKKNNVTILGADGATSITLFLKGSPLTVEEALAKLNLIFVQGVAPVVNANNGEVAASAAPAVEADPFALDDSVSQSADIDGEDMEDGLE